MKRLIAALLLSLCAALADTPVLQISLAPVSTLPGTSIAIPLTMSGSTGLQVAAMQWALTLPPGVSFVSAQSTVAGKAMACATTGFCIAYGTTLTPYADGQIGTITVAVAANASPGVVSLALASVMVVNEAGSSAAIPVTLMGSTLTVTANPCDLNTDGVVNVSDVQLIVNAIVAANQPGGTAIPLAYDLTADGYVDDRDVQRVVIAANGGGCKVGP